MIDIKKYLNPEKIKPLAIAAACFVAVFTAGYGVGKSSSSEAGPTSKRSLSNYTTNNSNQTKSTANTNNTNSVPATSTEPPVNPDDCYIKGSKSKTYHMPGGSFYERTSPAACFNSEEEAQAAGYKKSSR